MLRERPGWLLLWQSRCCLTLLFICKVPWLRGCTVLIQESKLGWRSSALPSQGHHRVQKGEARTWGILAGDLSSGCSLFCITMDRRLYLQKGFSDVVFPFMLKHQCLGFVRQSVQVTSSLHQAEWDVLEGGCLNLSFHF